MLERSTTQINIFLSIKMSIFIRYAKDTSTRLTLLRKSRYYIEIEWMEIVVINNNYFNCTLQENLGFFFFKFCVD